MNKIRKIKFTNKELTWIERTADIESARALEKFFRLANTDLTGKDEKEKQMLKGMGTELIDLYLFLRSLRTKLEFWDARYDVDTEIIEQPMNMNYRESVAWQLGYGQGFIAGCKDTEDKIIKMIEDYIITDRQYAKKNNKTDKEIDLLNMKMIHLQNRIKELSGEKP